MAMNRAHPSLRIAQIVPGLEGGGLEKMVVDLTLALRARGHVVEVFNVGGGGPHQVRLGAVGVPVHDCRRQGLRIPGMTTQLRNALAAFGPHVLHAHSGTWYQAASGRRSLRSARLVFTDHGRYPSDGHLMHLLVQRWSARAIDCLVAVSGQLAQHAQSALHLKQAPIVIENGIDLSAYAHPDTARRDALRAQLGFQMSDIVVASVGRLEEVKNHRGLFDAFARAVVRAPSLKLIVLGVGTLEVPLRELAASLGIASQIRFLGFRDDIPQCLLASDIFAMPSHTEGLPLALLEAMAAGLPVVASPVGGIPAALGDYPEWMLPLPRDPARIAESLERLARDARLRSDIGARLRARAAGYSLDHMTSRYEAVYASSRASAG